MTFPRLPSGSIVVGLDSTPESATAARWAAARAAEEHRLLCLVHESQDVAPWRMLAGDPRSMHEARTAEAADFLESAAARLVAAHPGLRVSTVLRHDDPARDLVRASAGAELVVLGSRRRNVLAALLSGSVSAAVAACSHCPVVVVRQPEPRVDTAGVICAVAGRRDEHEVLAFAFEHASRRGLPLTILRCHPQDLTDVADLAVVAARAERQRPSVVGEMDDGLLDGLCDRYRDVDLTFELERGRAHEVLRRRAASADLLVLGRALHRSALDLLPSPVTRPLRGRSSGVIAVVPH